MENASLTIFDALIAGFGGSYSFVGLVPGLVWCSCAWPAPNAPPCPKKRCASSCKKSCRFNLGALLLSVIGLMMVVVGIYLG